MCNWVNNINQNQLTDMIVININNQFMSLHYGNMIMALGIAVKKKRINASHEYESYINLYN